MPVVVQNPNLKKVPNVKPVISDNNKFTNISLPFGKGYGTTVYGRLAEIASNYKPNSINLPAPGEGLPRVVHYCADQSGCAFWRMIWPGDELLASNRAVVMTLYQMITIPQFYMGIDAVRLQRQCTAPQIEFIKFLRHTSDQLKQQTGKGFKIIWEVDDVVCPASDIPDYNVCKAAFTDDVIFKNVKEAMKYVDEVTVVSSFMREHYRHHLNFDKISVIPNYAPKHWIDRGYDEERILRKYNAHKNKKHRIMYAGSGTHFDVANKVNQQDDFGHVIQRIIQDITVDKKYEWVFFGACPMALRQYIGNGIEFHDWTSINQYPEKIHSLDIDIAIAPLSNNTFSRAKANIKLSEFGTLGIPCIAQNLECYNSDNWQYLFDNADELFDKMEQLLKTTDSYISACKFAREYGEDFFLQNHLDEYTLMYTTDYGDSKRKENKHFLKNNPEQFQ